MYECFILWSAFILFIFFCWGLFDKNCQPDDLTDFDVELEDA